MQRNAPAKPKASKRRTARAKAETATPDHDERLVRACLPPWFFVDDAAREQAVAGILREVRVYWRPGLR
jgi:hypothetical protein